MNKSNRKKLSKFAVIIGLVCILAGVSLIGFVVKGYFDNRADNNELVKQLNLGTVNVQDSQDAIAQELLRRVDFDQLTSLNSEICGWVYIPDTHINYPLLKASNNTFYLKHNYKKEKSSAGAVFLDANDDANSSAHWIFGHHMRDNSMFADIARYRSEKFSQSHMTAYVALKSEQSPVVYVLDFEKAQSLKGTDTLPKLDDNKFAFATCGYNFDDERVVAYFQVIDQAQ